jgi:hypothetical protein
MKRISVLAGLVAIAATSHAVVIDNFTSAATAQSGGFDAYVLNFTTGAMGNTRTIQHQVLGNPDLRTVDTFISGGFASVNTGVNVNSQVQLMWFGQLASGGQTSDSGLMPITNVMPFSPTVSLAGNNQFTISVAANDLATTKFSMRVWDTTLSNSFTSAAHSVAVGSSTVVIPFSEIAYNLQTNNIGGVALIMDLPQSNDVTITNVAAVPEPASLSALGLALLALRRRKRA